MKIKIGDKVQRINGNSGDVQEGIIGVVERIEKEKETPSTKVGTYAYLKGFKGSNCLENLRLLTKEETTDVGLHLKAIIQEVVRDLKETNEPNGR